MLSRIQKSYLERRVMSANMFKMQISNGVLQKNSLKTFDFRHVHHLRFCILGEFVPHFRKTSNFAEVDLGAPTSDCTGIFFRDISINSTIRKNSENEARTSPLRYRQCFVFFFIEFSPGGFLSYLGSVTYSPVFFLGWGILKKLNFPKHNMLIN